MLFDLPFAQLGWIVLAIVIAGVIHGALGFGFPFIATPLVAIVTDLRMAVITLLLPTLAITTVSIVRTGPILPVIKRFWVIPVFSLAGAVAGTWVFVMAPEIPYMLILALVTLAYLYLDRLGLGSLPLVRRNERPLAPLAGLTAGIFEGTLNVSGPPLIVFYLALGLTPASMVQALNISFTVSKLAQFTVLATHGEVTPTLWVATLPLALLAATVFFVGLRVRNRGTTETYRAWVKRALLVIALAMLGQYVHTSVR